MSENAQDITSESDGSLFSTLDIIMLAGLLGVAIWWLYSSRKENNKDDVLLSKYSIQ